MQPAVSMPEGGYEPPLFVPNGGLQIPFREKRPEQLYPQEYKYSLQQRIETEWKKLLGDDFKASINLDVFRDKAEEVIAYSNNPESVDRETFMRKMMYLKIGAISIATSLGVDIYQSTEDKLMEKMQSKYPPNAFTELRVLGKSVDEARRYLKALYESGQSYELLGVPVPSFEQQARAPRKPSFPDFFQDIGDTWQRSSFGSDLRGDDRAPIALGEAQELIDEFSDLSENEIDSLKDGEKLKLIIGEVADVIIAVDGYFSANDLNVEMVQKFALDRMVDTYGDLPKLRRAGVPTRYAMSYLREAKHRLEKGLQPPPSPIPGYAPFFRLLIPQPEVDFSSNRLH